MYFPYTYSVVIPHFNSSKTLERMLSSIPERDDIQIIVIDDYSCKDEIESLKKIKHKNLEIYYNKKNQGGGYSRNEGFSKVKGKWFLGCDADDFFSDGAFNVFDSLNEDNFDYVCYCTTAREEGSLKIISAKIPSDVSVRKYLNKPNEKNLKFVKFRNYEPWNKMISVDFIRKNNIHWENCRINIDVMFSLQLGLHAKKIRVIPNELYNLVFSPNSITRKKKDIEREFGFYLQVQKRNTIYKILNLSYPFYRPEWMYLPFLLIKRGIRDTFYFYRFRKSHMNEVLHARKAYLALLQNDV